MKKIVRSIAIVALMIATASGMANEPKLRTEVASKNLVLELDAENNKTSVEFVDAQGNIIFSDSSAKHLAYIKKFNLETLPAGAYSLRIEDDFKKLAYTINVANENITIGKKLESFKPVFRKKDDKIFINLLNLNSNEVGIKVLDSNERVVYKEKTSKEKIVQKAFNFEKAFVDTYTIVINDGNDIFYEDVLIK